MIPRLDPDGVARRGPRPGAKRRYRPEHERRRGEGWRSEYDTSSYRMAREHCIERAHGRCQRCGRKVAVMEDGRWKMRGGETHHVVPLRRGGGNFLMLLCVRCHRALDMDMRRRETR